MNEILKANTGINLKRFGTKMGLHTSFVSTLNLSTLALGRDISPAVLASNFVYALLIYGGFELSVKRFTKYEADERLRCLASSLKDINIYTDADSIKNARLYKTQYKLVRDEKPFLQQNKYIMLPTTGSFNADEVSLLQEHNVGSKEYVLSMGEPKKRESKVFSGAFAR